MYDTLNQLLIFYGYSLFECICTRKNITKVNGRSFWARELFFGRNKTIFAVDMLVCVENCKLLELIGKVSKVPQYLVNIEASVI